MKIFTYSEARQHFATVLELAQRDGIVRIMQRDGKTFTIQPEKVAASPLNVKAVKLKLKRADIVAAVREGRERN